MVIEEGITNRSSEIKGEKLKRYKAERICNKIVISKDKAGKYRAISANEIRQALTDPNFETTTAEVLIGNQDIWYPLRRSREKCRMRNRSERRKKNQSSPSSIVISTNPKAAPLWVKLLIKLRIKSPLEELIYRGEANCS